MKKTNKRKEKKRKEKKRKEKEGKIQKEKIKLLKYYAFGQEFEKERLEIVNDKKSYTFKLLSWHAWSQRKDVYGGNALAI